MSGEVAESPSVPSMTGSASVSLFAETFEEPDLPTLRHDLAQRVGTAGVRDPKLSEFLLVLNELVANAIRHGGGGGHLRVWTVDGLLHCTVVDTGPGLPDRHRIPVDPPLPSETSGRGLWIARKLSRSLTVTSGPAGTTAHAVIAISPAS